ncbi:MAG TPA: response regulator transcription factor [Dehalococcoidia bacterium]|nr:response regulator transcription factor [Dehalococcoidia bacterium]
MAGRIRVLIVDDHPVVLQGLEAMLSHYPDVQVVAQATSGASALRYAERLQPDVVLLDIRMPGSNGVQVARRLKQTFTEMKVLILTTYEEDEYLFGALEAGADGYLLKTASPEELSEAIRKVHSGTRLLSPDLVGKVLKQFESVTREKVRLESGLSLQEISVLELVADGATNKEIAERLYWSEITVKRKLQDIVHKLGASDRTQAVAEGMRRGLI